MLRQSQALHATDKRDRVNATLNLVTDYDDDGTESNYEVTLAIRYLGVARMLPFKCNSLLFLVLAKTNIIPDADVEGLPSWAPNWNPVMRCGFYLVVQYPWSFDVLNQTTLSSHRPLYLASWMERRWKE